MAIDDFLHLIYGVRVPSADVEDRQAAPMGRLCCLLLVGTFST